MKLNVNILVLGALAGGAAAFPAEFKAMRDECAAQGKECPFAKRGLEEKGSEKRQVGFNPKLQVRRRIRACDISLTPLQYASNTRAHAFVARTYRRARALSRSKRHG